LPNPLAAALCVAWTALVLGCTTAPALPEAPPAPATQAASEEQAETTSAAPDSAALATPEVGAEEPAAPPRDLLRETLAYADRTLGASTVDLAREIARLSELDDSKPSRALRLALVLAQTRQSVDTARALGLVQRTLANAAAKDLHPLARLLETRLTQQRRLEEQLDRQAQQLRDAQRRNDQLSERLEAVRAIERSLTTRPTSATPPPPPPGTAASSAGSNNGTAKP
jgi:hypothetical protein